MYNTGMHLYFLFCMQMAEFLDTAKIVKDEIGELRSQLREVQATLTLIKEQQELMLQAPQTTKSNKTIRSMPTGTCPLDAQNEDNAIVAKCH